MTEVEDSVPQSVHDRLKEEKAKVNTNYKLLRQQFQEVEESHHQLVTVNYRKRKNCREVMSL
ncbi:hypothetical protein NP493_730g00025 [Ridgeia piscesae]|uniref:Uncharacterized protein n=1 Tax=Ridgeia piscesae TaxID=27915 RepID=A0AAD9NQ91_RIDPI|nr:hypothetical protein NP493_730g00025 [Ridgeia piscesae]